MQSYKIRRKFLKNKEILETFPSTTTECDSVAVKARAFHHTSCLRFSDFFSQLQSRASWSMETRFGCYLIRNPNFPVSIFIIEKSETKVSEKTHFIQKCKVSSIVKKCIFPQHYPELVSYSKWLKTGPFWLVRHLFYERSRSTDVVCSSLFRLVPHGRSNSLPAAL